jgi:hypothetical protein
MFESYIVVRIANLFTSGDPELASPLSQNGTAAGPDRGRAAAVQRIKSAR